MNLKAEAKQLKDEKMQREQEKFADRSQIHNNTGMDPTQAYDLVHIGRIEDHNKAEKSFNRNSSSGRFIEQSDFHVDQKENIFFDDNNQTRNEDDPFNVVNNTNNQSNFGKRNSCIENKYDDQHRNQ